MSASVLLGIMSGNATRRAVSRCTIIEGWRRNMAQHERVQVVFVVGKDHHAGAHRMMIEEDVLYVPVTEKAKVQQTSSTYGTTAVVEKVFFFLIHAMMRPVPNRTSYVAIADDDTFLNLPMLHAVSERLHVWSLATQKWRVYAGGSRWFNMFTDRLEAIGFGSGPQAASYWGHRHANCTVDGSQAAWHGHQERGRCVGPHRRSISAAYHALTPLC